MRLLVLGGTLFLGRHLVETALARGVKVTLFNRGRTAPDLFPDSFPGIESLVGDRDGDLSALGARTFDAVIDTCGYVPRVVRRTAEALRGRVGHYAFVSSLSVYAGMEPGSDETAPLEVLAEPGSEDVQKHYGALKVLCEREVEEVFPGRALQARAGMIVGPYDRIYRFPYWVERLSEGGTFLAPGRPDAPLQVIDARDIAGFLLDQAERGTTGPFNLTGPEQPLTLAAFLERTARGLGAKVEPVWVDDAFLEAQGPAPVDGIPYWLPPALDGFFRRDVSRALAAGLRFRPLEETAADTGRWLKATPFTTAGKVGVSLKSGITRERERELLAAWAAARG